MVVDDVDTDHLTITLVSNDGWWEDVELGTCTVKLQDKIAFTGIEFFPSTAWPVQLKVMRA